MEKKRVVCLYRVSTKMQVDPTGDISMQEKACREFILKDLIGSFYTLMRKEYLFTKSVDERKF